MKVKYLALAVIALVWLNSCNWEGPFVQAPQIYKDTLNYSYKVKQQRSPDCTTKSDNGCNLVKFSYPAFNAHPDLDDSVYSRLGGLFSFIARTDTNFSRVAKSFLILYGGHSANDVQKPPFFPLNEYAKVVRQDSALVTIEIGGYQIKANSPAASKIGYLNWNTKANKKLALSDLFKTNTDDSLKTIAEGVFRQNEKLSDTATLAKNYLFKDGKFALNDNYLITPYGLRFLYNESEIKPRSAGFTILFIPYGKIKTLLKPHTVLTRYVK